jgi:cytochrome c oxidase assembly protein subunit 15
MATIVASSAFLRLSAAGLGCSDWPACYGQLPHANAQAGGMQPPEPGLGVRLARVAHRISAMVVGVLVILTLAVTTQRAARSLHNLLTSAALLVLTVFLAVLGRYTAGTLSPAVALANLAGGYAMLMLFWSLFVANDMQRQRIGRRAPHWLHGLALFALLLTAAQALLGGLVSAKFGAAGCADLASCWPTSNPIGTFARALDPSGELVVDPSGRVLPGAEVNAAQALHRAIALVLVPILLALAVATAGVAGRRLAGGLLGLAAAAQAIAGGLLTGLQFPLALALLHNALGAILLMCIVTTLHRSGLGPQDPPRTT